MAIREPAPREALETVRAEKLARLNESLEAANRALTERNRELQEFASIASHDLQEPLRKIRSFSTLLRDEYGAHLDETAAYYLDRMYGSAVSANGGSLPSAVRLSMSCVWARRSKMSTSIILRIGLAIASR